MGRPNIEPEVLFLCTRFSKSTVEYKAKLNSVLQFLKQTINYKRVVGAYNLNKLCT